MIPIKLNQIFKGFVLFSMILHSCNKDSHVDNFPSTVPLLPGEVTEVGIEEGIVIRKVIGAAGGFILNDRVIVSVPPGALDKDVEIGLQPISNTNKAGKGLSYRMTPHGITFHKPITITFRYTEEEAKNTFPQALGIAYQNSSGVWMAVGGVTLREDNHTVSIKTTHFSDWSLFEFIHIDPSLYAINPGENINLSVRCLQNVSENDILMPLTKDGIETALGNYNNLLNTKFIGNWELIGQGILKSDGSKALYIAPTAIPERNPSEIAVTLKSGGKSIGVLISKIYVSPLGISVQADGNEWKTFPYAGVNNNGPINNIVGQDGNNSIRLSWKGKMYGMFKWSLQNVTCAYILNGGTQLYQHIYGNGLVSDGEISIEPPSEFIQTGTTLGTFKVKSSGNIDLRDPDHSSYKTGRLRGLIRLESN